MLLSIRVRKVPPRSWLLLFLEQTKQEALEVPVLLLHIIITRGLKSTANRCHGKGGKGTG